MEEQYLHPAFPQPDDTSITLWRYMNYEKFKWLVDCGRLYMSSANRLGDPLEGTNPEGNLKWWKRQAEKTTSLEKQRIIMHNCDLLARMIEKLRNYYYVSCWHVNQNENTAMWEYYTTEPTAVAIKTTYKTLKECLPEYVDIGIVRYIDYSTECLPPMNMFEYIMHKDTRYNFENEVRVVVSRPPIEKFGLSHFRENLLESESSPKHIIYAPSVNLEQFIHGVVLSPEASPEFNEEVTKMCITNRLPKPEPSQIS